MEKLRFRMLLKGRAKKPQDLNPGAFSYKARAFPFLANSESGRLCYTVRGGTCVTEQLRASESQNRQGEACPALPYQ